MVFLPARYKEQDVLITKSNELRLCGDVWKHIDLFIFKQKTAYEVGTGDWSSDVCSSDLGAPKQRQALAAHEAGAAEGRSPEAAPSFCRA